MRIDSSHVTMESTRIHSVESKQSMSFMAMMGRMSAGGMNLAALPGSDTIMQEGGERAGIEQGLQENFEDVRGRLNGFSSQALFGSRMITSGRENAAQLRSIRQQCIEFLFRMLFNGGRNKARQAEPEPAHHSLQEWEMRPVTPMLVTQTQIKYEYRESEATSFSTTGTVRCADGREIEFGLNMIMTREFQAVYEESYTQITQMFTDPLVINLDGFIAELSDQTFIFDIDADGETDIISMLSPRSGYLAWDKNGDGMINDGNELFGTQSGNGFLDLALHDLDGNGWIDEADDIWQQLLIWIMEADGSSALYSLAEKGIGAIYLGHLSTEFTLADETNAAKGMISHSGLFLYESGAVGSIQQVDVVKYEA